MLRRRLSDVISALRETALNLPPGPELTAVMEQLQRAAVEENQRLRIRLQSSIPDRRDVTTRPNTINSKIAVMVAAFKSSH